MTDIIPLRPATRTHADGSACRAGTRDLPLNYQACCSLFEAHTATCEHDIRYEWRPRTGWQIAMPATIGGGGLRIRYCPHCGTALA